MNTRPRLAAGFTLVESLVAMVVLSVGMLGIAAMYVEGLRAGRTSVYRQAAVELASDLADRIRANPTAGAAYAGAAGLNGCVNGAGDCTPAQLAADDLSWWQSNVDVLLPAGDSDVDVAVVAGAGVNNYTITLTWSEPGADEPSRYALAVQL
jgi:type IV pilus assembly protein PilV